MIARLGAIQGHQMTFFCTQTVIMLVERAAGDGEHLP